jgi:hypothetical protein
MGLHLYIPEDKTFHRLGVPENKMLRRIFGHKKEETTIERNKESEELNNLQP